MAKSQNVISIPIPPASAYNKERPVSELIWMQVEHLAAVVKKDIDDERRAIRTEGDASVFVKKYTDLLHPRSAGKKPTGSSKGAAKKPARKSKR